MTSIKLSLGVVLGSLRAIGHIGSSEQDQILENISTINKSTSMIDLEELEGFIALIRLAAEAVTIKDGTLDLDLHH